MVDHTAKPINQQRAYPAEPFLAQSRQSSPHGDRSQHGSGSGDVADTPVVDWERAAERIPGGAEALVELAQLMQEECHTAIETIRKGIDGGHADLVRRGAHSLKGSAGIFEARQVVAAALKLESMGQTMQLDGATAAFEQLSRRVELLIAELKQVPADQQE